MLRIRTKVAALAVAGSTAGLMGIVVGTATAAPAFACGSTQSGSGPVDGYGPYSSGGTSVPTPGSPGDAGVSGPGGYVQATGEVGGTAPVDGNITASGGAAGQSGTIAVGNDGSESGPVPSNDANLGVCQG